MELVLEAQWGTGLSGLRAGTWGMKQGTKSVSEEGCIAVVLL